MTDTPSSGAAEAGDQDQDQDQDRDQGQGSPVSRGFPRAASQASLVGPRREPATVRQALATERPDPGRPATRSHPATDSHPATRSHPATDSHLATGKPDPEPAMAPPGGWTPAPQAPKPGVIPLRPIAGRRDPRRRVHVHPAQPEGHPRHRRRRGSSSSSPHRCYGCPSPSSRRRSPMAPSPSRRSLRRLPRPDGPLPVPRRYRSRNGWGQPGKVRNHSQASPPSQASRPARAPRAPDPSRRSEPADPVTLPRGAQHSRRGCHSCPTPIAPPDRR